MSVRKFLLVSFMESIPFQAVLQAQALHSLSSHLVAWLEGRVRAPNLQHWSKEVKAHCSIPKCLQRKDCTEAQSSPGAPSGSGDPCMHYQLSLPIPDASEPGTKGSGGLTWYFPSTVRISAVEEGGRLHLLSRIASGCSEHRARFLNALEQ